MAFKVELPELPYEYDALEPVISKQTVELHHDKHHQAYTDKFNAAAEKEGVEADNMEDVFSRVSQYSNAIRNHGGGWWNHCFYWESFTRKGESSISGEILEKINETFGSFEEFKNQFSQNATTLFGSGWTWLGVRVDGSLVIHNTQNQDNVYMDVVDEHYTPLLGIDMWEHAYYLDYQNKKADHVDQFFNIVNWEKINERLNKALSE